MNYNFIKVINGRKTASFSAPFFVLSALILFALNSCKESDTLGSNLLPSYDQSQLSNSSKFSITAFTVKEDSIKSDDLSLSLLGSYVDPVFGKSTASFITQFVSGTNQLDFGPNPVADSVVLSLTYAGYYGKVDKLNGFQKLRLYESSTAIYKDSNYYSSDPPSKYYSEANFIAECNFLPDPTGKYQTGTPVQKFKLPLSFGQHFLDNQSSINSAGLTNFFHGIYFRPTNNFQTSGNGAILSFNLISTDKPSKITLYFHNDTSTVSQQFVMSITSDCARINFFEHARNGIPEIAAQLIDTTQGKNNLYLQNMAGLSSKLWFTNIENWKDSMPLAITKAELIIPVETSQIGIYGLQSRLLLVEKNTNGEYGSIPDFELGENYFNGTYDPKGYYKFNIAAYLQEVISGKRTQKGLYLVPTASAIGANRVVLKGSNFFKLNVTYTKIK